LLPWVGPQHSSSSSVAASAPTLDFQPDTFLPLTRREMGALCMRPDAMWEALQRDGHVSSNCGAFVHIIHNKLDAQHAYLPMDALQIRPYFKVLLGFTGSILSAVDEQNYIGRRGGDSRIMEPFIYRYCQLIHANRIRVQDVQRACETYKHYGYDFEKIRHAFEPQGQSVSHIWNVIGPEWNPLIGERYDFSAKYNPLTCAVLHKPIVQIILPRAILQALDPYLIPDLASIVVHYLSHMMQ
jgi:hypothetical protein